MKVTQRKKLILSKETLRDLAVRNEAQVKGGKRSQHGGTRKCGTWSC